jgi:Phytochelatin synthase
MRIAMLFLTSMTLAAGGQDSATRSGADAKFLPLGKGQIALSDEAGRKLLMESTAQEAYWALANFYAPQHDKGSCSVASCIMVLNALAVPRPKCDEYEPYRLFTPKNLFTSEVADVVLKERHVEAGENRLQLARETVSESGMNWSSSTGF